MKQRLHVAHSSLLKKNQGGKDRCFEFSRFVVYPLGDPPETERMLPHLYHSYRQLLFKNLRSTARYQLLSLPLVHNAMNFFPYFCCLVLLDNQFVSSFLLSKNTCTSREKIAVAQSQSDEEELLSDKQKEALDEIKNGSNVFITGVAGTGKSLVLKRALDYLKDTYNKREYVALGPTGPSAIALEGQTIHSFAGIGIPRTQNDFLKTKKRAKQWKDLKVIVLDEVSMVSAEFFDLLSDAVSGIRKDPRTFGGIQLVICGDFLQLSPISPRKNEVEQMLVALQEKEGLDEAEAKEMLFLNRGFCFQSYGWENADFKVIELEQVFRQQNKEFIGILQDIRRGTVSPATQQFLDVKCKRPLPPNEFGIRPTILHSKNVDVARDNLVELNQLEGESMVYESVDTIEKDLSAPKWAENQLWKSQFFTNCIAEKKLHLKVGAQVMLIKNEGLRRNQLVNGSRGKVVAFRKVKQETENQFLAGVETYPVVQFVNGAQKVILPTKFESRLVGIGSCTRLAIPLKLAWAVTTHKAQGLTLDYVLADVGQVFAESQTYVALSRASDENGLEVRNFHRSRVRANQMALAFYENPKGAGDNLFPYWDGGTRSRDTVATSAEDEELSTTEPTLSKMPTNFSFKNKTFVFAGKLRFFNKDKIEMAVEKEGGIIRKSVSGKTDFLILGRTLNNGKLATMGAQYRKAITYPAVSIVSEEEFLKKINPAF